jgi:hypothetical protein
LKKSVRNYKEIAMKRILLAALLMASSAFAVDKKVIINPVQDGDTVIKVNDGGVVSSVMTFQGSTGRVGIGTTDPQASVEIRGANTLPNSNGNLFVSTSDPNAIDLGGQIDLGGMYNTDTFRMPFGAIAGRKENATPSVLRGYLALLYANSGGNLAEGMRINSDGYVGIGTTIPSTKLELRDNTSDLTFKINASYATTARGATIHTINKDRTWIFGTDNTNSGMFHIYDATAPGYRMVIDSAGKVGIGTPAPSDFLHVQLIPSGNTGGLVIKDGTDKVAELVDSAGGGNTGRLNLYHANSVTTQINANSDSYFNGGSVGIGTTSPAYKLQVKNLNGAGIGYLASFTNQGDDPGNYGIDIVAGNAAGTGNTYYINARDGDGHQVGYIWNTGGTFQLVDVPSDMRFKNNIRKTDLKGMSVINAINIVDFEYKKIPGIKKTGFIAQEVEKVLPIAVSKDDDGYLHIATSAFIPSMIKAIQEQKSLIDSLQKRIEQLENR